MAVSTSSNFNLTKQQIITDALMLVGAAGAEDTPSSVDVSIAGRYLDSLIKSWEAEGCGLWAQTEATLFLDAGTVSYTLGGSSSSHIADVVVETTTSAASVSGATTVTATIVTGMTVGDVIGIILDDATLQWTTIDAINTGTKVITLHTALTDDVASGNRIYTYTTTIHRPYDVHQVRYRKDGDIDRVLEKLHRADYFALPQKSTSSTPTSYYYDTQLSYGTLYLWPAADTTAGRIKLTYQRALEDMDAATDNPDFPQEWLLALVYNLAVLLAPIYGKDAKIQTSLGILADQAYRRAKSFDIDDGPSFWVPDVQ